MFKQLMVGGLLGDNMNDIVNDPKKVSNYAAGSSLFRDFDKNYNRALDLQQLGIRAPRTADIGADAGALAGVEMAQNIADRNARQGLFAQDAKAREELFKKLSDYIAGIGRV